MKRHPYCPMCNKFHVPILDVEAMIAVQIESDIPKLQEHINEKLLDALLEAVEAEDV